MAYSILRIGKPDMGYPINSEGTYHEYICDLAADISTLPTTANNNYSKPRAGSTAIVASNGDVYMLSPSRVWVKLIEGTD